jgi:hypothetical protein
VSLQRQQIKEQLGALEEQVELLGALARSETLEALNNLHNLIHNDTLRKSLPASDFLHRVISVLTQEASALGFEIAVSHFGEGRMSAEMVEVSMGAIMACIKASLRSYRTMNQAMRTKHNLFRTYSLYIEIRANANGVQFKLVDDAKGYSGEFITGLDNDIRMDKLRSQVADHGGWFSRRTFPGFGGAIEFRVPLPHARFECLVLKQGDFEMLVPVSYCTRIVDIKEEGGLPFVEGETIANLSAEDGIRPPREGDSNSPGYAVQISVADVQYWVLCDLAKTHVKSRRYNCADFVEEYCWYDNLGLFPSAGALKALPLLEGGGLLRLYNSWGATNAGI